MEEKDIREIVHILGIDVSGKLILPEALVKIKGIGRNLSRCLAKVISEELNVDEKIPIGKLSEAQIKVVENIIKHPEEKLPAFLLNKRGDKKVGKDRHLVMSDLIFDTKQNIEFEKSLYTWRGFRHAYGQKVRGQCTRTSGRKGLTVGVIRSKTAKAAKAAEEKKKKE